MELHIDGTVAKHNDYKFDGYDILLPNVKEFFESIPKQDRTIFVTSRTEDYKETTERFLSENRIRFDSIIYGLPYGERTLINDSKSSGLSLAYAITLRRE